MPMKPSDYHYAPRPNNQKALSRTPYDQTRILPSTREGVGKFGGLGKKVSGGAMNTGGKQRSGGRKGGD